MRAIPKSLKDISGLFLADRLQTRGHFHRFRAAQEQFSLKQKGIFQPWLAWKRPWLDKLNSRVVDDSQQEDSTGSLC
jgi:hypothetical protein